MSEAIVRHYLEDAVLQFRKMKQLGEKALSQVSDAEFLVLLDQEANSLGLMVKHIGGNLRSRWTDFLSSDGEKEWRQRDGEFMLTEGDSRESLMRACSSGIRRVSHCTGLRSARCSQSFSAGRPLSS